MRTEQAVPAVGLAKIRAPFLAAGATLVDPPVIQPLNLFLDLVGEQMRSRLFVVNDEGGREGCLRPDFTVPIARMHVDAGQAAPARYLYEGKAFRVAPRDAGAWHPEEFLQLGLEIHDEPAGPDADAEVIELAWRASLAGGREDLVIRLGDASLITAVARAIGVPGLTALKIASALSSRSRLEALLERAQQPRPAPRSPVVESLAGLDHDAAVARLKDHWRDRGLEAVGGRTAEEIVARLEKRAAWESLPPVTAAQADVLRSALALSGPPADVLDALQVHGGHPEVVSVADRWRTLVARLSARGIPGDRLVLSPGFARTFGYYDEFFFEIQSATLPGDAPVAAGGRYDRLGEDLGGWPTTAVGCVVRPARAWSGQ